MNLQFPQAQLCEGHYLYHVIIHLYITFNFQGARVQLKILLTLPI
jgi:hypothetical protein